MKFNASVERFENSTLFWEQHLVIPDDIFLSLLKETKDKRVICTLNKTLSFHCAMLPKTTFHYILLNKETCKKLNIHLNDDVEVELIPDTSKYGMTISEEFQEVLFSDPIGSTLFHQLTPGKQRTLIHVINKYKSAQLKIEKSFVILEHLKNSGGQLDFKGLNEDFKNYKNKFKF
ncbi:MAG: DUF1905 domain-containing protein [Flavobacterium sp.]